MIRGFTDGSVAKNLPANAGVTGLIPQLGISPEKGMTTQLPVFLPGTSHGSRSRVGYSPWGRKELDTTEQLKCTHTHTHPVAITLPTNVHLVKTMVFPVVMYECESWTPILII